MIQKKIDLNLVPENIKNIAWRTNPENPHVNTQERLMAVAQLENIISYCEKALATFSK